MIIALSSEMNVMSDISHIIGNKKSLIYIDTASNGQGGDMTWRENQIEAIEKEFGKIDRYSIEGKTIQNFEQDLSEYDIIHIGGGNTAYLLHHVKETGFDLFLKKVLETKTIIGSSAGAIILGKDIEHIRALDDFSVVELGDFNALNILKFDIWVHFGKEKYINQYRQTFDIAYRKSSNGIYLDDNSYIVSRDKGDSFFLFNSSEGI